LFKLMIVDDEALICSRLKNDIDFASAGFVVCAAVNSARQALQLIGKENPDVIIVDIMMPDMNGLELIEAIRAKNSSIRIIILSGYDEFKYAQRALELGVCKYLLKPVNKKKLIEALQNLSQQKNSPVKKMSGTYESVTEQLTGSFYVAAFEMGLREKKRDITFVLDLFLTEAEAFFPGECRFVLEQQLVFLLFPCTGSISLQAIEEQIRTFLRFFEKTVEATPQMMENKEGSFYCYVGIVSPAAGQKNLCQAKKNAENLLEYCYFSGNTNIAVYNKVQLNNDTPSQPHSNTVLKKEVSAILYNMLSAHVGLAISHLKDFFNTYLRFATQNRKNFLIECNMFYLLLGLILEETGFCDIVIPTEQVYQEISVMESYGQVLTFFENEIVRIRNQVTGIDIANENSLIFRIKQYVLKNYQKNISLNELSQTIYLSASYLSTYFKKQTGQTISDYMIMVRIEQAKQLLVESNNTVNQIAEQVGYSGYRYFSTLFKNITGVTPIQYRLKHMSEDQGGKYA